MHNCSKDNYTFHTGSVVCDSVPGGVSVNGFRRDVCGFQGACMVAVCGWLCAVAVFSANSTITIGYYPLLNSVMVRDTGVCGLDIDLGDNTASSIMNIKYPGIILKPQQLPHHI